MNIHLKIGKDWQELRSLSEAIAMTETTLHYRFLASVCDAFVGISGKATSPVLRKSHNNRKKVSYEKQ